jgi:hypothetical protein
MTTESPTEHRKLSEVPISTAGREAFVALALIAVIVAIVSGSIPVAVAVLAVGGLLLGGVLLLRARRTEGS